MHETTINLKHEFDDAEKAELGNTLSTLRCDIESIKDEVSSLNARKTAKDKILLETSLKFRTGHEFRDVECQVELNQPEDGRKIIRRLDKEPGDPGYTWEADMNENDMLLFQKQQDTNPFDLYGFKERDIVGIAEEFAIINSHDDLAILGQNAGEITAEEWEQLQGTLVLKFLDLESTSEFVDIMLEDRPGDTYTRFAASETDPLIFITVQPVAEDVQEEIEAVDDAEVAEEPEKPQEAEDGMNQEPREEIDQDQTREDIVE